MLLLHHDHKTRVNLCVCVCVMIASFIVVGAEEIAVRIEVDCPYNPAARAPADAPLISKRSIKIPKIWGPCCCGGCCC